MICRCFEIRCFHDEWLELFASQRVKLVGLQQLYGSRRQVE